LSVTEAVMEMLRNIHVCGKSVPRSRHEDVRV
jgi:hypothetical protein